MPDSVRAFETLEVQYEGEVITFAVVRSRRRKTCSVIIDAQGVYIAASAHQDLVSIGQAIIPKLPAVLDREARYKDVQGAYERQFVSGESLRLLGRPYLLRVVAGENATVEMRGTRVFVTASNSAEIRTVLERWFRAEADSVFSERVPLWAHRLGVTPGRILLRSQRTRWGSCDVAGNLRLNWRLVMAPMSLIDYVIAHELAHLRAPDHSQEFWSVLRAVMPDYQLRKRRLDRSGVQFDL